MGESVRKPRMIRDYGNIHSYVGSNGRLGSRVNPEHLRTAFHWAITPEVKAHLKEVFGPISWKDNATHVVGVMFKPEDADYKIDSQKLWDPNRIVLVQVKPREGTPTPSNQILADALYVHKKPELYSTEPRRAAYFREPSK